jgi:hypothetical protein
MLECAQGQLAVLGAPQIALVATGLSYQRVYKIMASGAVPAERDEGGVYAIARRDAKLIARRPPARTFDPKRSGGRSPTLSSQPSATAKLGESLAIPAAIASYLTTFTDPVNQRGG